MRLAAVFSPLVCLARPTTSARWACCATGFGRRSASRRRIRRGARRHHAWTYNDLEMMRAYVETLVGAPHRPESRSRSGDAHAQHARSRGDPRADDGRPCAAISTTSASAPRSCTPTPRSSDSPPVVVAATRPRQQKPRLAREETERDVIVKSFDGRVEHFELTNPHWDFAMDVLERCRPRRRRSDGRGVVSRGRRLFRPRAQFRRCARAFRSRSQVVPDDADVLYGEACLHETLGAPRIQNYVRVTTLPNGLFIRGVDRRPGRVAARRRPAAARAHRSIRVSSRRDLRLAAC